MLLFYVFKCLTFTYLDYKTSITWSYNYYLVYDICPHRLVSKFNSPFLGIRESIVETLLLVCNAIIVSRSINLFALKD
jgi:hypothetical protein